jgi:hypothetical protein
VGDYMRRERLGMNATWSEEGSPPSFDSRGSSVPARSNMIVPSGNVAPIISVDGSAQAPKPQITVCIPPATLPIIHQTGPQRPLSSFLHPSLNSGAAQSTGYLGAEQSLYYSSQPAYPSVNFNHYAGSEQHDPHRFVSGSPSQAIPSHEFAGHQSSFHNQAALQLIRLNNAGVLIPPRQPSFRGSGQNVGDMGPAPIPAHTRQNTDAITVRNYAALKKCVGSFDEPCSQEAQLPECFWDPKRNEYMSNREKSCDACKEKGRQKLRACQPN